MRNKHNDNIRYYIIFKLALDFVPIFMNNVHWTSPNPPPSIIFLPYRPAAPWNSNDNILKISQKIIIRIIRIDIKDIPNNNNDDN